jgi:hypothetical protein
MVKLTRADQLKLEADKDNKKSILVRSKSVDFYDTDILGKSFKNTKSNVDKQKSEKKSEDNVKKDDLEFHEQFFS